MIEVTAASKDAGYDVMDLAHNHILDSGLENFTTADAQVELILLNLYIIFSYCM